MTYQPKRAPRWVAELNVLLAADKKARAAHGTERQQKIQRLKRSRRQRSEKFVRWFIRSLECDDEGS